MHMGIKELWKGRTTEINRWHSIQVAFYSTVLLKSTMRMQIQRCMQCILYTYVPSERVGDKNKSRGVGGIGTTAAKVVHLL